MSEAPLALQQAIQWLQSGQLALAEQHLDQLLRSEPDNPAAHHLLGVVLLERNQPQRAVEHLERSAQLNAAVAMTHYNLGNGYSALLQFEDAVRAYRQAVALKPEFPETLYNCGNALKALDRWAEAESSYAGAVHYRPSLYQAHNNRGDVLRKLGRRADALASFEKALELKPTHAEALNNRGLVLHELGRDHEALESFRKLITIDPEFADGYNSLGLVLQAIADDDRALTSFDRAVALNARLSDAWSNRGGLLTRRRQFDQALASCARALEANPNHAGAHNNRGIALQGKRDFADALAAYDAAIAARPDYAEAWNNRGNALHDLRRLDEATQSFERAIALQPGYAEAINNRGMVAQELRQHESARRDYDAAIALRSPYPEALRRRASLRLLQGDFPGGWADFEMAHEATRAPDATAGIPYWHGEPLEGKSILLSEPNGLGDTLQFIRFAPRLIEAGARVAFLGPASVMRLLRPFSDRIEFMTEVAGRQFDFQCWLWSLPHYLQIGMDQLSAPGPYLGWDPDLAAHWSQALDPQKFNVGICWQGNPERKIDPSRSIPLAAFLPVARVPGVRLVSLQKNFGLEQLQHQPSPMSVDQPGPDFDSGPDAFVDSAAMLAGLDLVITADTSMTHLAGAIGRPAWLALTYGADWRWLMDRSDTPWYPCVRLFRQQRLDDWAGVFNAMAEELHGLALAKSKRAAASPG